MNKKPFLKNLNGLRFLAASYTIFFHYFSLPNNETLNNFFSHGHISVPFFFLLSGFVLSYSYHDFDFSCGPNTKNYLLKRIIRLAPIYYISMGLAIPLLIFKQLNQPLTVPANLSYALAHLTMIQSLIPLKPLMDFWNVHSWSLSVEVFLYFLSPIMLIRSRLFNLNKVYLNLFLMFLINTAIYLLASQPIDIFSKVSSYFAPFYLGTFFNGILLAKLYLLKREEINKISPIIFTVSSIVLLITFLGSFEKSIYSTFNPFFQFFFSLLILGSCDTNKWNQFLGGKLFFFLGEASYAMYLLQAPVKVFTQQFLTKTLGYSSIDGPLYCSIIFLSITFFAIILTVFIDPKLRKFLKERLISIRD